MGKSGRPREKGPEEKPAETWRWEVVGKGRTGKDGAQRLGVLSASQLHGLLQDPCHRAGNPDLGSCGTSGGSS